MITITKWYGSDCKPCAAMQPVWDKLKETFSEIKFVEICADDKLKEAELAKIRTVPTFIISKVGLGETRFTGVKSFDDFVQIINEFIS